MTRFAWLQARTQTLTATAALAVLAILAAITGVHLSHLYNTLIVHCHSNCAFATSQFASRDNLLDHFFSVLSQLAAPLIGIFWGAPLLTRELEAGTFRLAWTQSVSRSRWLVTKLSVGALASVLVAGGLTLTLTWWYRVLDPLTINQYAAFGQRDIAPIGYAAFAFALGAIVGTLIRRTLPAMATTLVGYTLVRIAVTLWVRPHLLSPVRATTSLLRTSGFGITSTNGSTFTLVAQGVAPKNAWLLSTKILTRSGHVASSAQLSAFVRQHCPAIPRPAGAPPGRHTVIRNANPAPFHACLNQAAHTFQLLVSYEPANRYWTLQWLETGIFFALALAAAIGCYAWVTRRIS